MFLFKFGRNAQYNLLKRLMPVVALLFGALLLPACKPPAKPDKDKLKLQIVATTSMIADTARIIGGDAVMVEELMGPGIDPHLYKASPRDMELLANADLILYNGLHLEAKLGDVLDTMEKQGRKVVAVTRDIPRERLIELKDFPGEYDPHVWMDTDLWGIVANTITKAIIAEKPKQEESIKINKDYFDGSLRMLVQNIDIALHKIPTEQRVLITAHDAFAYWGRAYKFEVRGLQGVSTASEAGARDVQEMATFIAEKKIPAIFVESSVPKRNIEALQEAVKAKGFAVRIGRPLYSDSVGDYGTQQGTYIGMLRFNAGIIAEELTPPDTK